MNAGLGALAGIEWSRPWLAPYRARGEPLAARALQRGSVAEAMNEALRDTPAVLGAGALRFVPQPQAQHAPSYEGHIAQTACVPTRDNAHDFFNALMWLHQPALKRRLNELQAAEIARHGIGPRRGPLRDALTVFDENGALLQAPQRLAEALRAGDWRALFVEQRAAWSVARLELFGHALLEKLMRPRKAITAHVWLCAEGVPPEDAFGADALRERPFVPLPVLGVPGWWPANESADFYDDTAVFRPQAGTGGPRVGTELARAGGRYTAPAPRSVEAEGATSTTTRTNHKESP